MGNNGNGRWLKFLRSEGRNYVPSLVVLQLYANDFRDNLHEGLFELSSGNRLVEKPVPPESIVSKIQRLVDKVPAFSDSHAIALLNHARAKLKYDYLYKAETDSKEDLVTYLLLEEIISICKRED